MDDKLLSFVGEQHYPFVKKMDDYLKLLREIHSALLLNEVFSIPDLAIRKENMEEEITNFLKENNYGKYIPEFYGNIIKQKIIEIRNVKKNKRCNSTLPSFC